MNNWLLNILNSDKTHFYSLIVAVGILTGANIWTFWFTTCEKENKLNLDKLLEKREELLAFRDKLEQLEKLIEHIKEKLTT